MLAFIIAVKHPARSRSYERVTELLRQTLASVEAQTDTNFVTIIVCNQRPPWAIGTNNRLIVEVDFPPAPSPSNVAQAHCWFFLEKGAKNAVGLLHARQFDPTHVMFVDADFVSRRMAEHVRLHRGAAGWYFERGLVYSEQFRIAEVREKFWSYCSTSRILRYDLLPVRLELGVAPSLDAVLQALDTFYVERILGNHVDFLPYVAGRGMETRAPPLNGSRLEHGYRGERFSPVVGTHEVRSHLREGADGGRIIGVRHPTNQPSYSGHCSALWLAGAFLDRAWGEADAGSASHRLLNLEASG